MEVCWFKLPMIIEIIKNIIVYIIRLALYFLPILKKVLNTVIGFPPGND